MYNMKEGKQECLEMETLKERKSSADSSTSVSKSVVRVVVSAIAHLKYAK